MDTKSIPTCYVLVGIPGSGKSTWATWQRWAKKCAYISTDKYVEQHARRQGKTYSEVFEEYMPQAIEKMAAAVVRARESQKDIIWDQTSTTIASRARKFRMLPGYSMVAVVFKTPEPEELDRRLKSRAGKEIPKDVVESMINDFVEPSASEGFDEVWYVG